MAPNRDLSEINEKSTIAGNQIFNEVAIKQQNLQTDREYRHKVKVPLLLYHIFLHISALYGLYLAVTLKTKTFTLIWGILVGIASIQGVILGAHRGFSHRSFKLTTFGQILLIALQTLSGEGHIYNWAREHRLHHKFADTDADPHNATRGFFFSHMGWLLSHKHPLVIEKEKFIDMSDLETNKIVMFQKKYIVPLTILICVLIPTLVPVYGWNENFWYAFFIGFALRYVYVLHMMFCINSVAHFYGSKPYDKRVSARESPYYAHFVALEERWHNYHHAFPYDHSFSEFGAKDSGISTMCLRLLHRLGIAYDLRTVPADLICKHSKRYGDGSFNGGNVNTTSE